MSKLDELIQEYCPNGVEYKKFSDLVFYEQPTKYIVESTKYDEKYRIPVLTAGQTFILGYTNENSGIYNAAKDNPVIIFDDFTGALQWVDFPFKVKSSALKILTADENKVILRYVYHVMKKINFSSDEHKRLWIGIYSNFQIPVPPLPVQKEIVRILDNFTDYTEKLKTELDFELTARKKQYEYYRDKLLMWDKSVKTVKLEELFPFIRNGFVGTVTPYFTDEKNGVRYIRGTNIHDGVLVDNDYVYINKEFHQKNIRSELKSDDILVVQSGHVGDCARVGEKYKGSNCHALIIMTNGGKCDSQYVVYYLQSREGKSKLEKITTGGTVKHILASAIKKLEIPIPPLETQKRIVHVLDNFEKICSDLNIGLPAEIEARQKQYEYYRDALLTFAAKGDIIVNRTEQNRTPV